MFFFKPLRSAKLKKRAPLMLTTLSSLQVLGHHPVPADGRSQSLPLHGRAGLEGQVRGQPREAEDHVLDLQHAHRRKRNGDSHVSASSLASNSKLKYVR